MAHFRSKKLDLGCFINIRIIRDHTKRYRRSSPLSSSVNLTHAGAQQSKVFAQYETDRQALRYIIRNTTLPQRTRAQAQLELAQMHAYTRRTQVNNRCIEGGKSRGVLSDFRMSRVSDWGIGKVKANH